MSAPTMPRLCAATLPALSADVARPRYDRARLATGIVHLGLGAFHRAHQAVYTEDALTAASIDPREPAPWGICGVSLRSPDTRDALAPQDHLYSVASRDGDGQRLRVVGALTGALVAPESPQAVLDRLADPATRLVTLTVTEQGYCRDPATGGLAGGPAYGWDDTHPDIRHDLAHPEAPRSMPGLLVAALARRRRAGIPPFTVLSCDNLPGNGALTATLLRQYAELGDPALAAWMADHLACPDSMVDRIVPATTDADRATIAQALGLEDAAAVVAEPYGLWVVEDRFPTGRPAWEAAGVRLVDDVRPYELMKLRLLNGSHSCLAYLGCLAGHETIADTVADPIFATYVHDLMEREITPTLPPVPGMDLAAYRTDLRRRFANPALRHRTAQVATDGSLKLPLRLLPPLRHRLERGLPAPRLLLGIAAWMHHAGGRDLAGRRIEVRDPLATSLRTLVEAAGPAPEARVAAFLGGTPVFGDMAHSQALRDGLCQAYHALMTRGARGAAADLATHAP